MYDREGRKQWQTSGQKYDKVIAVLRDSTEIQYTGPSGMDSINDFTTNWVEDCKAFRRVTRMWEVIPNKESDLLPMSKKAMDKKSYLRYDPSNQYGPRIIS